MSASHNETGSTVSSKFLFLLGGFWPDLIIFWTLAGGYNVFAAKTFPSRNLMT